MSMIEVAGLTFGYDGSYDIIFDNVSFRLDTDWKLGFTGRNGRGKTTFLNLLLGKYEYRGTIRTSVSFDYFPFPVLHPDWYTADVLEEICCGAELWKLNRELNLLEVPDNVRYRPFETLSKGEQTKVLLAALFLKENNFLLIDEPTNHLDRHAREVVSRYLNSKRGFILVSHDRAFLDGCVDHILSINKTNIEVQSGNFSSWLRNKEMQDQFELAANDKLKKEISRLSAAAKRTSGWSNQVEKTKIGSLNSGLKPDKGYIGHKAAKMMKRAKIMESRQTAAIEEKSKLLRNLEEAEPLAIHPLQYRTDVLLEAKDLCLFYGERQVCGPLNFQVCRGDRVALCGRNGSGKSSILKLILGESLVHTGELRLGSGLVFSYVSQDTSFLTGNLTNFARENGIDESLFKTILRKLDFSREQFEKNLESFSEGQKKKVLIAKSLCEPAHLYLWDEPLNFIDVLSRMQLEALLTEYRPTMLFVEHDAAFTSAVATKQIDLSGELHE